MKIAYLIALIALLITLATGNGCGLPQQVSSNASQASAPGTPGAPPEQTAQDRSNSAPNFINVRALSIINEFWIMFDTDTPTNCYIEYGPRGSFAIRTDSEKDTSGRLIYPVTGHGLALKNLYKNTEYQYRIIARNKDGLTGTSTTYYYSVPDSKQ
jgi:hypothetical protein